MTSTSAIQPLTNKVEDEDDIEFALTIGSQNGIQS
jgi:hypothetical protein